MTNKIFLSFISIVLCIQVFAQAPEKFNYQAVIRNSSNELIINQDINIKVSILDEISSSTALYSEEHSVSTNAFGIVNLEIGNGTLPSTSFSTLNWEIGDKFLKIEIDENAGSTFTDLGTVQLLSVPYALFANSANNLGDENIYTPATDTLFVVKDNDGNVVFAVFPDGAVVYVNETAKGKVGGFAVSGRTSAKGIEEEYLRVTPDSTRIYVKEDTLAKGKVGGFAVSGRTSAKGEFSDYLMVTRDSTRIFTQDSIGGFGVFDNSNGSTSSYMQLTPLNYFIGHESGQKIQFDILNPGMGKYNTFFGYKTGQNTVSGYKNIFMGYQAGQANISGAWNIFIGNNAGFNSQGSLSNIFIGDQAGYNFTDGIQNVLIGNEAGYSINQNVYNNLFVGNSAGKNNLSGNYNTYMGISAGYNTLGSENAFVGNLSGFSNYGSENTFMGSRSGIYSFSGVKNVYIGYKAGYRSYGSRNVFIGTNANNTNFSSVGFSNCVAIGDSVIVAGDNEIRIGNSDATSFYAQGVYATTTGLAANLYIYASGRIVRSTSSKRYKKDITPLEINTSDIYKLNPVSFTSKSEGTRHFGLIAEEVAEVIPELADFAMEKDVIPGSDSERLIPDAVQYQLLSVLLLKEIQKHELNVNKQAEQIEKLETENKELQQRLKKLEELLIK